METITLYYKDNLIIKQSTNNVLKCTFKHFKVVSKILCKNKWKKSSYILLLAIQIY